MNPPTKHNTENLSSATCKLPPPPCTIANPRCCLVGESAAIQLLSLIDLQLLPSSCNRYLPDDFDIALGSEPLLIPSGSRLQ